MLPDEVRKAVEAVESHADDMTRCIGVLHAYKGMRPVEVEFSKAADELKASALTIRAHLLAREAEVERLNAAWDSSFKQAMLNGQSAQEQRARAERAEALLRDVLDSYCASPALHNRITAHLSENSRG